jgi:hypothetical protein
MKAFVPSQSLHRTNLATAYPWFAGELKTGAHKGYVLYKNTDAIVSCTTNSGPLSARLVGPERLLRQERESLTIDTPDAIANLCCEVRFLNPEGSKKGPV